MYADLKICKAAIKNWEFISIEVEAISNALKSALILRRSFLLAAVTISSGDCFVGHAERNFAGWRSSEFGKMEQEWSPLDKTLHGLAKSRCAGFMWHNVVRSWGLQNHGFT